MIEVPTDRLHKFFAVGGLVLCALGITFFLERFNEAELQRIEASVELQKFINASSDYAENVNEAIAAHNRWVKNPTIENKQRAQEFITANKAATEKLGLDARDFSVESKKQLDLALHYQFMRNVWFVIAVLFLFFGALFSYYGFTRWWRESKETT